MVDYKDQLNDSLGFYLVKIKSPEDIKHPIIPFRSNGKVIYPVGEWSGWYFSEELKNAEK